MHTGNHDRIDSRHENLFLYKFFFKISASGSRLQATRLAAYKGGLSGMGNWPKSVVAFKSDTLFRVLGGNMLKMKILVFGWP